MQKLNACDDYSTSVPRNSSPVLAETASSSNYVPQEIAIGQSARQCGSKMSSSETFGLRQSSAQIAAPSIELNWRKDEVPFGSAPTLQDCGMGNIQPFVWPLWSRLSSPYHRRRAYKYSSVQDGSRWCSTIRLSSRLKQSHSRSDLKMCCAVQPHRGSSIDQWSPLFNRQLSAWLLW